MKFSDLQFIRIDKPELFTWIPRYLFEQVKDHTFNIDKIYQLAHTFIGNPATMFYALADKEAVEQGKAPVKGILWANINVLTETINVNILSVDKEYQFSDALEKTLEFIKSWQGENENLKIQMITTRPHAYKKIGFQQSKRIIMEIE